MKKKRRLKVYGQGCVKEQTPTIVLKGNWLEFFNFTVGSTFEVDCENNKLIITKMEE